VLCAWRGVECAWALQLTPARVDGLHGMEVVALAAGKFHSAALTRDGTLYTWGFGRGGRLGDAQALRDPSTMIVTVSVMVVRLSECEYCRPELLKFVVQQVLGSIVNKDSTIGTRAFA